MKVRNRALVVTVLLSTFGVALVTAASSDKTLEEIAGYRQWNRVTLQPIAVELSSIAG